MRATGSAAGKDLGITSSCDSTIDKLYIDYRYVATADSYRRQIAGASAGAKARQDHPASGAGNHLTEYQGITAGWNKIGETVGANPAPHQDPISMAWLKY